MYFANVTETLIEIIILFLILSVQICPVSKCSIFRIFHLYA